MLTNGMIMRLELESIGPGETNIIAFAQSGTDNTIAAAFDATTISGLQAWLKADVYSGLPTGFQTNWWDSSGASPNRKADNVSAGAVLPSYVNNSIGGKPAFAFSSDVNFLTNGWNVADTDFTAFVVGRLDTTYNGQVLDRYGMNGFSLVAFGSTFTPYNSLRYYLLGNTVATLPQAEKATFITAFGRTGTTFYAYNGSGTTNTTIAATTLPTYCTGSPSICGLAIMSGAGGYPTRPGVIAEVLYHNTRLSSVNVSNVLGYLRTKYGTQ